MALGHLRGFPSPRSVDGVARAVFPQLGFQFGLGLVYELVPRMCALLQTALADLTWLCGRRAEFDCSSQ